MDLDFRSVKALASRTRVRILRELLRRESATTAALRDTVDVAQDQLMMHLETLRNAGLVDAQPADSGMGHEYLPTEKAQAIVKGEERKVTFSMGTATLSAVFGTVLLGAQLPMFSRRTAMRAESELGENSGNPGVTTGPETGDALLHLDPLLVAGVVLIVLAAAAFLYGHRIKQLAGR